MRKIYRNSLIPYLFLFAGCTSTSLALNYPDCLTLEETKHNLKVPGVCGDKIAGEGQTVCVSGYIDWHNVFDRRHYPELPYEKFKIYGGSSNNSMEIWVESDENDQIFKKIYYYKDLNQAKVSVTGTVAGFDMPVMGSCRRGIKIILTDISNIRFNQ